MSKEEFMKSADLKDFQQKTRARLEDLRTRIDILEKRSGRAEADIQVRYDQKIGQLRGQYAQVKAKADELGRARLETWTDEKNELDRAIDALSEAIDYLARRMSA